MRFFTAVLSAALLAFGSAAETPCPASCECGSLSAVCEELPATKFGPAVLQLKLRDLREPVRLDAEFFARRDLLHLESLAFENCTVGDVDPNAFAAAKYLQILSFANASLPTLNRESFVFATQLQVLTVEGCDLKEMIPFKSESIQILKISRCNIEELTEESLIDLPELTDVTFSYNSIEKIDAKAFQNNVYLEELDLSYNKIAKLPRGVFKSNAELAALDLSGNPLKEIDNSELSMVEKLVLKNCNLREFKGENFTELGYLGLSHNQIGELTNAAFADMPELEYLDLSGNKLKTLPGDVFANNKRLQKIHLDFNEIEMLPKFVINKEAFFLTYYFSCKDCGLENLTETVFQNMPMLVTLNLSTNRLQKINPKMLSTIPRVSNLDLSYNMIADVPLESFVANQRLTKLNLAGNTITSLNPVLFERNAALKTLDVSNNKLKTIWSPISPKLPSIEVLNLADNRLETITTDELEVTPNIQVLNVNNNQFNCTSAVAESARWLHNKSVSRSALGTHAEFKNPQTTEDYIGSYWKNLCDEYVFDISYETNDAFEPYFPYDYNEEDDEYDDDDDEEDDEEDDEAFGPQDLDEIAENDFYEDVATTYLPRGDRYNFIWPIFIFVSTALFVLLVVTNIILCVLRKRGHLPRNINLTWKNAGQSGFVYKPLTEEIPRTSIIITGVEKNQTQCL